MGMNIKDPEVHRLAAEIARQTGDSMTKVVRDSLLDRQAKLEQKHKKPTVEELMALAARVRECLTGPAPDIDEMLYDEHGLPK